MVFPKGIRLNSRALYEPKHPSSVSYMLLSVCVLSETTASREVWSAPSRTVAHLLLLLLLLPLLLLFLLLLPLPLLLLLLLPLLLLFLLLLPLPLLFLLLLPLPLLFLLLIVPVVLSECLNRNA